MVSRRVPRSPGAGSGVALGGGIVVLLVAALAFEPRIAELPVPDFAARFNPLRAVAALGFGLTGATVVSADSRNRVGWLMFVLGASQALSMLLEGYGIVGIHAPDPGPAWPDAALAVALLVWAWPYFSIPALLLLLVPDGRLPSPRWRPVAFTAIAAGLVAAAGWFLLPPGDSDVDLHPEGFRTVMPTWADAGVLTVAGGLLATAALIGGVAAMIVRRRSAPPAVRRQLTWVLAGGALSVVLGLTGVALGSGGVWVAAAAVLPLPLGIAVAVGRFALWDEDGLLRRLLVGAVLAAGVLACYLVVVLWIGGLLGETTGPTLVAIAAVAVAVVPAHRAVVRWANRLVYGEPEDPAAVIGRLGARLDAVARGDVLREVCRELATAVRASGVSVIVDDEQAAMWGEPGRTVAVIPLHHAGTTIGELRVSRSGNLSAAALSLLRDLAPHVAVVANSWQLDRELDRSRERLLAAREDERARLQRELHDGVGPTLAALAIQLDQGRLLVDTDTDAAIAVLEGLSDRLRETVSAVRSLVTELQPPPLDELGLRGALQAESRRFRASGVEFRLHIPDLPPLPAAVELACFRIASEAMTNVVRHARAQTCDVSLAVARGILTLSVADDGCGFSGDGPAPGVGLRSMRERAALLGGGLEIDGERGRGAVVRLVVPVDEERR